MNMYQTALLFNPNLRGSRSLISFLRKSKSNQITCTVGMDNIQNMLANQWEKDTPGMYGSTENRMGWSNIAPAGGMHMFFPR